MHYKFTSEYPDKPWSGAQVPIISLLSAPMKPLSEALKAKGWRLEHVRDLLRRVALAHLEGEAEKQGKEYEGEPSNFTGEDEMDLEQLMIFVSLRAAGVNVTFAEVEQMPYDAKDFVVDPFDAIDDTAEEVEAEDPTSPLTASAPAVNEAE